MRRFNAAWIAMIAIVITLSSCEMAGDIFQAGMVTTVIIIVVIIAIVLWLVSRFRK